MTNQEDYDKLLHNLHDNAVARYQKTQEYRHQRRRREEIDQLLAADLTSDQKALVDEVLFELNLNAERESEVVYRQGLRDCIWLLKYLGVLA